MSVFKLGTILLLYLVVLVLIAVVDVSKVKNFSRWVLLPRTSGDDLKSCGDFFDEETHFSKANQCIQNYIKQTLPGKRPECYVVLESSPDVKTDSKYGFNYINPYKFLRSAILGFYDDTTKEIYIINNKPLNNETIADTYEHEVLHYVLDILYGDGDGHHVHPAWMGCFEYGPT